MPPGLCHRQHHRRAAYFLLRTPLQESTAALTGVILVFAIRMLATHYRWSLPRISEDQQTEPKK